LVKSSININTSKIITQFINLTFNNKELMNTSKKCKYFPNFLLMVLAILIKVSFGIYTLYIKKIRNFSLLAIFLHIIFIKKLTGSEIELVKL
jgi:hypothetical protein